MGSKIQGEGDYESARNYNDETRKFVEEHTKGGKQLEADAAKASDKLTAAEQQALEHAKHGEQDKRDAKVFTSAREKRKPGSKS